MGGSSDSVYLLMHDQVKLTSKTAAGVQTITHYPVNQQTNNIATMCYLLIKLPSQGPYLAQDLLFRFPDEGRGHKGYPLYVYCLERSMAELL